MKIVIMFKDPGAVYDSIEYTKCELVRSLQEELGISNDAAEVEAEERFKKMNALIRRYFKYGEYVSIELDDETGTVTVLEAD